MQCSDYRNDNFGAKNWYANNITVQNIVLSQISFMFFMQNRISDYVYFDDAVKNGTQEWIHI